MQGRLQRPRARTPWRTVNVLRKYLTRNTDDDDVEDYNHLKNHKRLYRRGFCDAHGKLLGVSGLGNGGPNGI